MPVSMTRSLRRILPCACGAAAVALLALGGSASAQSIGGGANASMQAAYAGWRRLSQAEVDCVDQALRARRTTLYGVIQRGIGPNDAAMSSMRAACRQQARPARSEPAPTAVQALASNDSQTGEATRRAAAEQRTALQAAEQALSDKVAAELAAARKAAAERIAAERAAAESAAADRAAAEKAVAEQSAAKQAAEQKAAAEQRAAEQAAARQAAEQKPIAEKRDAEQAARKASESKAADKPAARTAADAAAPAVKTAAAAPVNTEPAPAVAEPDGPEPAQQPARQDEAPVSGDAAYAYAVSESRMSFLYGLLSGPVIFCLGGFAFLLIGRRRAVPLDRAAFDGVVEAVLAELRQRETGRDNRPADARWA